MVAGKDVCLRRLSKGDRALEVRFNRFLGNAKVTAERIIESWSESTVAAVVDRHVLAIQDTSEIHFNTTPQRRRGLGEIGKGNNHGVLLHPMLAVDADNGTCLGLLSGELWTRAAAPSRMTCASCRIKNRSVGYPTRLRPSRCSSAPPW
jgi:hypothetical protein